jgi:CHAT domain-containing protein
MLLAPSIKNLIIVPDGVLCYLPFETLILGESEKGKATFLIENFQVSYAPSVTSLALLAGRRPATGEPGRILALGDPVYASARPHTSPGQKTEGDVLREIYQDNGFEFSRLPYSRREVLGIASAFRDKNVDLLTGWEAREDFVKTHPLENYRIIHFACHGFLDESAPHRSALVLSLDSDLEEDGFLQAREVYELRLKADLVVLSACQTGRGRLESGEGLLGLPRMFFYAGARATISSLWKITDRSTASLMQALYEQLAAGADAGRALRKAKLEMLKTKFAHPFYWGGFVLHGEYRRAK